MPLTSTPILSTTQVLSTTMLCNLLAVGICRGSGPLSCPLPPISWGCQWQGVLRGAELGQQVLAHRAWQPRAHPLLPVEVSQLPDDSCAAHTFWEQDIVHQKQGTSEYGALPASTNTAYCGFIR